MDAKQTLAALKFKGINVFWSWGGQAFTLINCKALRFKVNGHHHKGHVYIYLNSLDYYVVTFTTLAGTIKKTVTDIFCENLAEIVDDYVDKIPEYKF